jgi:hypothetical protein
MRLCARLHGRESEGACIWEGVHIGAMWHHERTVSVARDRMQESKMTGLQSAPSPTFPEQETRPCTATVSAGVRRILEP